MTVSNVSGDTTSGDAGLRRHAANPDAHHRQRHLLYGPDHTDVDRTWELFEGGTLVWSESVGKFVLRPGARLYDLGSIDGGSAISSYFGQQLMVDGGVADSDWTPLDGGGAGATYYPAALQPTSFMDGGDVSSSFSLSLLLDCGSAATAYTGQQHLIGGYA